MLGEPACPTGTVNSNATTNSGATDKSRFRFSFRNKKKKDEKKVTNDVEATDKCLKFLAQDEAQQMMEELLTEYCFSMDQVIELEGYSSAVVISKVYPKETLQRNDAAVLVCCGPGTNGAQALVCARHLKLFGFRPTVFYPLTPSKPLYKNLVNQCERMDIPFLSYMPSETHLLDSSYNVVIDGIFGFNFTPPVRPELSDVMQRLKQVKIPVISIDVPSGWDVESGDVDGIQPDTLISLLAPKACVRHFHGRNHYLAGRFLPSSLVSKYQLNLPTFPGSDCYTTLPITASDKVENVDG